jgi:adenosyl cobinamide kinase/adenosyl cobinamide phosphate guanylyltransferase
MTLVIGGAGAGKRDYIASLGWADADIADGIVDDKPVIINLQRAVFDDPESADRLLPTLRGKYVIACDEVGSGVIPLDRRDREARDACGRLCCKLATQADKVVRVVCGIPIIIKG